MTLLLADDLTFAHPGRSAVLQNARLTVSRGSNMVLLGANGSGKTTLLRMLAGAIKPKSGQVLLDGQPLKHSREGLRRHRQRVQLVLQDPDDQLFSADVTQDISFGPMNMGLPEDEVRARVDEALQLLGCEHLATRATHQLSYGERKRIATAGAVAMRPDVLMLDEPTAGLDPQGVRQMMTALARVQEHGTTIVLATHDVAMALEWADEAAVVCEGTVQQGPVTDMMADVALAERAHLEVPWPLALASQLGISAKPRTLSEVISVLKEAHVVW